MLRGWLSEDLTAWGGPGLDISLHKIILSEIDDGIFFFRLILEIALPVFY